MAAPKKQVAPPQKDAEGLQAAKDWPHYDQKARGYVTKTFQFKAILVSVVPTMRENQDLDLYFRVLGKNPPAKYYRILSDNSVWMSSIKRNNQMDDTRSKIGGIYALTIAGSYVDNPRDHDFAGGRQRLEGPMPRASGSEPIDENGTDLVGNLQHIEAVKTLNK